MGRGRWTRRSTLAFQITGKVFSFFCHELFITGIVVNHLFIFDVDSFTIGRSDQLKTSEYNKCQHVQF